MDQTAEEQSGKSSPQIYFAAVAGVVLVFIMKLVGWALNDKTELTPDHSDSLELCFAAGCVAALVSVIVVMIKYKRPGVFTRLAISTPFALIAFLAVSITAIEVSEIVENWIDFPASSTQTFPALLSISRAYQTHGKGQSWNIQTTPLWSNLDITEADYRFMLAHRRSGDQARNPDEISSRGHFCAKVTMQRSGEAIRVLNAGDRKLPQGTVLLCPNSSIGSSVDPTLPYVTP